MNRSPAIPPQAGRVSIVIPVHNQLAYTRNCLTSLRRHTDESHEVIVVDNGSTDGTAAFLQFQPDVWVISNAENRGFPAAVNQGILAAQAEAVLLLNNDTLLTPGWLRRMLDTLDSDPRIGLVGPCSNHVSGPQRVLARYGSLRQLDQFARDWGTTHERQLEDVTRLVGFCLLIRRAVIDRIGLLDEQFGIGGFEDDDYTRRALAAGFRAVIARDAFVHHFGSRTFRGSGFDLRAILAENGRRYAAKWSG